MNLPSWFLVWDWTPDHHHHHLSKWWNGSRYRIYFAGVSTAPVVFTVWLTLKMREQRTCVSSVGSVRSVGKSFVERLFYSVYSLSIRALQLYWHSDYCRRVWTVHSISHQMCLHHVQWQSDVSIRDRSRQPPLERTKNYRHLLQKDDDHVLTRVSKRKVRSRRHETTLFFTLHSSLWRTTWYPMTSLTFDSCSGSDDLYKTMKLLSISLCIDSVTITRKH